MLDSLTLSLDELFALAPLHLPMRRAERYQGGCYELSLSDFWLDEAEVLRLLYSQLSELKRLTDTKGRTSAPEYQKIIEFVKGCELTQLEEQLESMIGELEPERRERQGRVLYKIASGAFASLCNYLMLIQVGGMEPEYVQTLFYLANDHRKVMRSLLVDLDVSSRRRDELPKLHPIKPMIEKWREAGYRIADQRVDVRFSNFYEGNIAERSLEITEIDMLFYHLANNCALYSEDRVLTIQVAELPDGENLRWAFSNRVSEPQYEAVEQLKRQKISLFEHGTSTAERAGFGLGLLGATIVHAYGLEGLFEAREQGYFGSTFVDDHFVLWFHWPRVDIS